MKQLPLSVVVFLILGTTTLHSAAARRTTDQRVSTKQTHVSSPRFETITKTVTQIHNVVKPILSKIPFLGWKNPGNGSLEDNFPGFSGGRGKGGGKPPPGFVAADGCDKDEDCEGNEYCFKLTEEEKGICKEPCTDDFFCPSGFLCIEGKCEKKKNPCNNDFDCPDEEVCKEGICGPKDRGSSGSGGSGGGNPTGGDTGGTDGSPEGPPEVDIDGNPDGCSHLRVQQVAGHTMKIELVFPRDCPVPEFDDLYLYGPMKLLAEPYIVLKHPEKDYDGYPKPVTDPHTGWQGDSAHPGIPCQPGNNNTCLDFTPYYQDGQTGKSWWNQDQYKNPENSATDWTQGYKIDQYHFYRVDLMDIVKKWLADNDETNLGKIAAEEEVVILIGYSEMETFFATKDEETPRFSLVMHQAGEWTLTERSPILTIKPKMTCDVEISQTYPTLKINATVSGALYAWLPLTHGCKTQDINIYPNSVGAATTTLECPITDHQVALACQATGLNHYDQPAGFAEFLIANPKITKFVIEGDYDPKAPESKIDFAYTIKSDLWSKKEEPYFPLTQGAGDAQVKLFKDESVPWAKEVTFKAFGKCKKLSAWGDEGCLEGFEGEPCGTPYQKTLDDPNGWNPSGETIVGQPHNYTCNHYELHAKGMGYEEPTEACEGCVWASTLAKTVASMDEGYEEFFTITAISKAEFQADDYDSCDKWIVFEGACGMCVDLVHPFTTWELEWKGQLIKDIKLTGNCKATGFLDYSLGDAKLETMSFSPNEDSGVKSGKIMIMQEATGANGEEWTAKECNIEVTSYQGTTFKAKAGTGQAAECYKGFKIPMDPDLSYPSYPYEVPPSN